jgi:hypothetical protein
VRHCNERGEVLLEPFEALGVCQFNGVTVVVDLLAARGQASVEGIRTDWIAVDWLNMVSSFACPAASLTG